MDPDLYEAVTEGNVALLRQLLNAATEDIQQQSDQTMNNLLLIAAQFNNVEVVKVIHDCLPTTIISRGNHRGDTPLHIAAQHNNAAVVKCLLEWAMETGDEAENRSIKYQLVKFTNRCGNTALHEAVLGRHHEVIEVLMEADKEVILIKNKREESPLYLPADRGLPDVLGKMLKVPLENENFQNLYLSANYGPDGWTPLHAAVAKNHSVCINILLEQKDDPISRADAAGRTPLHYAASFGYTEGTRCILKKDASIACKEDKKGLCPIHLAASKGYVGIIEAMLEYFPAAIETLNKEGQNVVHLATKNGRSKLVSYMLQQKSKFQKLANAKDINGNTPLHLATMNLHLEVMYFLIEKGNVDMSIVNDEGLTALDIAEMKQRNKSYSLPKVLPLAVLRINSAPSGRPFPIMEENTSAGKRKKKHYKKKFKDRFDTFVVVATLISSVTFTAGFTIPGGLNSDGPEKGMATLLRNDAFIFFVVYNTIAFYLSIAVVLNIIWEQWGDDRSLILAVNLSLQLLTIALTMMAMAFGAGLYTVIRELHWLAFLVLIIGEITAFVFLAISLFYYAILLLLFAVPYMPKNPVLRYSKGIFYLWILAFDRLFQGKIVEGK
ncbi:protein ACCELERATED CELL DEATH 6-like [Macadamia integrifolia]|uniref:protein ACCELERATED CELL DEATH 6-like n=1 Tax=Macadamia integrifolia TaxID=60698 RepID=UPI001C4F91F2|nr:protein ACCELERATED CELL DEATH 6-like [Macadamia integrifolia]